MAIENEGVPLDILQTVLLLLPLKSLLKFKTVCKSWNAIISGYDFARQHLQLQRIKSSTISRHTLIWGEGDGLALLKTSSCSNLMLWNPCTSQSTKIPCNYEFKTFGICRGPSFDDYKVVAICSSSYYAVYSFKAGLWSKKKRFPFLNTVGRLGAVFVDGFSFWITTDTWQLLYFDPRDQNFKKLHWPTRAITETKHITTLVITNLGGYLCVYDNFNLDNTAQLRIWILKDNDVDSNSWSEIIIKDGGGLPPSGLKTPLFLTGKNELLIRLSYFTEGEHFGVYNSVDKTFKKLHVPQSSTCTLVLSEAPCLNTLFFPSKRREM